MEARVTLASFDVATGDLRIDMSTQSAHQCRTLFAQMLGMPEGRIQVVAKDVGGGFGIKLQIYDDVLAVMLALKSGRPVLWVETRAENFLSGIHARDYDADLEAAFDTDGRILALKADWLGDAGWALDVVGDLLPFAFTTAVVLFLYRVLPSPRPKTREIWPGAVVAAALISLVRGVLELYFEHLADLGALYGSLGALMALLIFVYAVSLVLVFGAEYASEWSRLPETRREIRSSLREARRYRG
jgi:hypothetical protein